MGLFTNSLMLTIAISLTLMIYSVDAPSSCLTYNNYFQVSNTTISANSNFTSVLPNDVTKGNMGGITGAIGNVVSSFVDIVAFGMNFFKYVRDLVFAPLTCGSALGMPMWLQLIMSLPSFFMIFGLVLKRIGMGDN